MQHNNLNEQQQLFVEAYLVELNATKAAIAAGYSADSAASQGSRLLKNAKVAAALRDARQKRAERVQVTQDEVLAELVNIMRGDPRDLVGWDKHHAKIKPSDELTEAEAKRISEVAMTSDGLRVKFYDRQRAIELVGKHLGMFKDELNVSVTRKADLSRLSDEELDALEAIARVAESSGD